MKIKIHKIIYKPLEKASNQFTLHVVELILEKHTEKENSKLTYLLQKVLTIMEMIIIIIDNILIKEYSFISYYWYNLLNIYKIIYNIYIKHINYFSSYLYIIIILKNIFYS